MKNFVGRFGLALLPAVLLGSVAVAALAADNAPPAGAPGTGAPAGAPPAAAPDPRTPEWAYGPTPPQTPSKNPDEIQHVPGSSKTFTDAQIDNRFNPPDWFPDEHPPLPDVVAHGRPPTGFACTLCHMPGGEGHPESASLSGLPANYIVEQMAAFKSVSRTNNRAIIMTIISKAVSDDDVKAAADYFAAQKPKATTKVVEAAMVPKSYVGAGGMRFAFTGKEAGKEPIDARIIELPDDEHLALLRDPHSGFTSYVPPSSIKKGESLVMTGGGGKTTSCTVCHGPDLHGVGDVPRIAGRSPQYIYRQLNDIKIGKRSGGQVALMQGVVANMSSEDMIAVAAYLGSRKP